MSARLRRLDLRRITGTAPLWPLVVLFLLNAVDEFDGVAYGVLLPEIKKTFHLSLVDVGLLAAAVAPLSVVVGLSVAWLGDRRRRTKIAAAGMAVWAVFAGLTGLAPTLAVLYVARIGSDLGKDGEATHGSLLADWYPLNVRSRVFYAYELANPVAYVIAPITVGLIADAFNWRVPFVLLVLPALVLAAVAARLPDPVRGAHERRAAGADENTATTEEEPAGFSETFRVLYRFRSARWIYASVALGSASSIGLGIFLSLYLKDVFDLSAGERGVVFSAVAPSVIVGFLLGGALIQRRMDDNPGRALSLLGLAAAGSGIGVAVIAVAPNLGIAIAGAVVANVLGGALGPGLDAVASLVVPARMRTLGFATAGVWSLLGLVVLPIVGGIGDAYGIRVGILIFVPVLVASALCIVAAGHWINEDAALSQTRSRARTEARLRRLQGDSQVLLVRDVEVSYDGVQVLFGVNLEIADGEIVALLGTNGAGKSTLLRAISGLVEAARGTIVFDGVELSGADANKTAALGIVHIPGGRGVFPTLTVEESLHAAGWRARRDPAARAAAIDQALAHFPVLREKLDVRAGDLSGGEQQMLGLAEALLVRPKLLIVDELSLGLSPALVDEALAIIRAIRADGTAVLVVDQSVSTALRIADRAVFMEKGRVLFDGSAAKLRRRKDLLRPVFLGDITAATSNGKSKRQLRRNGKPILQVRGMSKHYGGVDAVRDASLELHEGEILGLIGPNGAGKTTLFDLISGFVTPDAGTVVLDGVDLTHRPAHERAALGLGRSFQHGRLWPTMTVAEAVAVALERHVQEPSPLLALLGDPAVRDSEGRVRERTAELLELLHLGPYRDVFVGELSTGTRKVVELAVLLANGPRVLLLDEPSSGLAQRETEQLASLLRDVQQRSGCSMLVIEHDMTLVRALADRLAAMDAGTVVSTGPPGTVLSDPRVVESYLGTL